MCCWFFVLFWFWFCVPKLRIEFELSSGERRTRGIMTCGMNNLEIDLSMC